jgi:CDP-glucose 4,6-dehydratase
MTITELRKVYKGKKVFLTGHTGFKGSWMLYLLHHIGADIKGYALATQRKEDLFNVIQGSTLCESVIADIRNYKKVEKEILDFQPDFIFHLAAQPLVRYSYENPLETIEVNALGTANVLEAVKKIKKQCSVILITTDKVYENKEWIYPYRENDRLGGHDPYSMSKACAELVISSFRNSYFSSSEIKNHKKGIASARAGNVIGGGDWSTDRLIPDIAKALSAGKPIHIRNPYAMRPWQHVIECIGGYLQLGAALKNDPEKFSTAWNFGPTAMDNITVEMVLEEFIKVWGKNTSVLKKDKPTVHEAQFLSLDINKTMYELKWTPKYNWREAVKLTAEWYKAYDKKPSAVAPIMTETIQSYFK